MTQVETFIPLKEALPYWPADQFEATGLDLVGLKEYRFEPGESGWKVTATVLCLDEIEIGIPGLDSFAFVIGSNGQFTEIKVSAEIGEKVEFRLIDVKLGLRFAAGTFKPARKNEAGRYVPDPGKKHVEVSSKVTLRIDGEGQVTVQGGNAFTLPPTLIGDSGIAIEAKNVALDLSATSRTPQSERMNLPESFIGAVIEKAALYLPADLEVPFIPSGVEASNLVIGNGGFGGRVEVEWADTRPNADKTAYTGRGAATFLGLAAGIQHIAIEFKQGALVRGDFKAGLILPFFDQPIAVDLALTMNGNFTVGLAADQPRGVSKKAGLLEMELEKVLRVKIASLRFEKQTSGLLVIIGGSLQPLLPGLDWPEIEVKKLAIDNEGKVQVDGGWLDLPKQASFNFHGFTMEVTKFGLGSEPDGSRWLGLSGGIKLAEGLPAGAAVDGLRITWNEPDNAAPRISFEGIQVGFEVKGSIKFTGKVSFVQRKEREYFLGSIRLELPSINLKADATLLIGQNKELGYSYWFIFLDVGLPAGVPLFASGAALYGLAGIVACNMEPNKEPAEDWYKWYLRNPIGVADPEKKWVDRRDSLAFGAGLTLGTIMDDGFSINAKTMLLLVFPGPIVMLEGQAAFLRKRSAGTGPSKTPAGMLHALAVLDGRAGDFRLNIDAKYQLPEKSGMILDINLGAEAYFNFQRSDRWHFYLGQKPVPKRIRARIISLFQANAYFMVEPNGIQFGGWAGYDANWSWGPVALVLQAWIAGDAAVSWEPVHLSGTLWLHGAFKLTIFGFGFGISADAKVDAQTPTPYHIKVLLALKIDLPWPLPDIEAQATLEWKEPRALPVPNPLREIAIGHDMVTDTWPLQKNAAGAGPVVPLDARPLITFSHPVADEIQIGSNAPAKPKAETVGDYQLRYELSAVTLYERANGQSGAWRIVGRRTNLPGQRNRGNLHGAWLAAPAGEADAKAGPVPVKLQLWSRTPFRSHTQAGYSWESWYEGRFPFEPCGPPLDEQPECVDFDGVRPGTSFGDTFQHQSLIFEFKRPPGATGAAPRVGACPADQRLGHALFLSSQIGSLLSVKFPEPVVRVEWTGFESYDPALLADPRNGGVGIRLRFQANDGGPAQIDQSLGDLTRPIVFSRHSAARPFDRIEVKLEGAGFVGEIETGGVQGGWLLAQVCYLSERAERETLAARERRRHIAQSVRHWYEGGAILAPNTHYKLEIATTAYRRKGTLGPFKPAGKSIITQAPFQTQGPPGLAELAQPGSGGKRHADYQNPLGGLELYIRRTFPGGTQPGIAEPAGPDQKRAMPGNPPRPVYRGYDVGVEFNKDYVESMYRSGGGDLALYLFDNNGQLLRDATGRILNVHNQWERGAKLELSESESRWIQMINRSDCAVVETNKIPGPSSLSLAAPALALEPQKLYEARLLPALMQETFAYAAEREWLQSWRIVDHPGASRGPSRWQVIRETVAANGSSHVRKVLQQRSELYGVDPHDEYAMPGTYVWGGKRTWADYQLSVLLSSGDNDAIGVIFRYHNDNNYYRYSLDLERGYRRLIKKQGGRYKLLAQELLGPGKPAYIQHRDTLINVEVSGAEIRILQDGMLVFRIADKDGPILTGAVGLYCWANRDARFKDVRVLAKPVHLFPFVTSRYVNFAHQVHAFEGRTWRHAAPASLDRQKLNMLVNATGGMSGRPTVEEHAAHEQLRSRDMLSLPRSPAQVLEITQIMSGVERIAYYLVSPEPIDWERTTLRISKAEQRGITTQTRGPVRISAAVIDPPGRDTGQDFNLEWIELFLLEHLDLSGYIVQHTYGLQAREADFRTYYTFENEWRFAAGARIQIHSGKQSTHLKPASGVLHRYVVGIRGKPRWLLNNRGDTLRILDSRGSEVLRGALVPDRLTPVTTTLLRSRDGTSAFIFVPRGQAKVTHIPEGRYRFEFDFARRLGDHKPVLKQGGISAPEQASIEIEV